MFKRLMPKEEKYFENFKEMIAYLQEISDLTHKFFSADEIDKEIYLKIKPIEKRLDDLTGKITKRLNKTFITPFDREDIFSLAKKLDDIADNLFGAAVKVDVYNVTEKVQYADKLTAIVRLQLEKLDIVIQHLKDNKEPNEEVKMVKDLESEADNIFRTALRELFQTEKDPINLIKKKEILEMLENATDKCQSTANVILAIYIKNS